MEYNKIFNFIKDGKFSEGKLLYFFVNQRNQFYYNQKNYANVYNI